MDEDDYVHQMTGEGGRTVKEVSLKENLYDLTERYPELIEVLVEAGFKGVGNPILRTSHGKVMTIPLGCQRAGLELQKVVERLEQAGFRVLS
jgi:uncharacterized protein